MPIKVRCTIFYFIQPDALTSLIICFLLSCTYIRLGLTLEYKYFARDGTSIRWESYSGNRSLVLPNSEDGVFDKHDGSFDAIGGDQPLKLREKPASQPDAQGAVQLLEPNQSDPNSYQKDAREFQKGILDVVFEQKIATENGINCVVFHPLEKIVSLVFINLLSYAAANCSADDVSQILFVMFLCAQFVLGLSNRAQIWNYTSSESVDIIGSTPLFEHVVTSVALSPKSLLAMGLANGDLYLADSLQQIDAKPYALHGKHDKAVLSMAFHASLPWLASGSEDATIRVWNIETRAPVLVLTAHYYAVTSLAFAKHCDEVLISGSVDRSIRIWDLGTLLVRPTGATISNETGRYRCESRANLARDSIGGARHRRRCGHSDDIERRQSHSYSLVDRSDRQRSVTTADCLRKS